MFKGVKLIVVALLCALVFYGAYLLQNEAKPALAKISKKSSLNIVSAVGSKVIEKSDEKKVQESEKPSDAKPIEKEKSKEKEAPKVSNKSGQNNGSTGQVANQGSGGAKDDTAKSSNLIDDNPNLIIKDCINNKVILAKRLDFKGKSVGDVTKAALDACSIPYRYLGGYFSNINGLAEKQHGALSGWVYYINGKKASTGCSQNTLNGNEIVEWKYYEDALNAQ